MSKFTKLIFENTFKNENDLANWEIMEFSEIFKGKEPVTGIVPTHVDDGEKAPTKDGIVKYEKKNVTVSDGLLHLSVDKTAGAMIKYKGGKFGKGYLEVKAKFPPFSKSVWPKMSLVGKNGYISTEVDFAQVMGIRGKNACTLIATYYDGSFYKTMNHLYNTNPTYAWPRFYPDAFTDELLSEGWHIFGCEQTDTDLAFFIDGIDFCRIDISHPIFKAYDTEGELVLSISSGMPKIEAPDETTLYPSEMQVEYVRFYGEEQ
ncbi:MAG: glycosyl hydrolase family protein [Ruminococcaceae bacterium]|nr:glycosyl hydrolase family protein [Oscillospiraceae bacterium]